MTAHRNKIQGGGDPGFHHATHQNIKIQNSNTSQQMTITTNQPVSTYNIPKYVMSNVFRNPVGIRLIHILLNIIIRSILIYFPDFNIEHDFNGMKCK